MNLPTYRNKTSKNEENIYNIPAPRSSRETPGANKTFLRPRKQGSTNYTRFSFYINLKSTNLIGLIYLLIFALQLINLQNN